MVRSVVGVRVPAGGDKVGRWNAGQTTTIARRVGPLRGCRWDVTGLDLESEVTLTGTIVPLVTPFTEDETVDEVAIARLVDFAIDGGADGLMPTALTGEGPLLSEPETRQVFPSSVSLRVPSISAAK